MKKTCSCPSKEACSCSFSHNYVQKLIDLSPESEKETYTDGYHSFKELYEFRLHYNAAFLNMAHRYGEMVCWKSRYHQDGSSIEGWFIVGAILPSGKQITNHYPLKCWDLFKLPHYPSSPVPFDGHTPKDCLNRLAKYNRHG